MNRYHIKLTEDEAQLVEMITLNVKDLDHSELRDAWISNEEPAPLLVESLVRREAIPEARRKYWEDPEYNIGGGKRSRREIFEHNGCKGTDIYRHVHFLPYLHYFLFGPDLDENIIKEFEDEVGNPEWITSGDIEPMRKLARRLTRKYQLDRKQAAKEFFKLCLDMGLGLGTARTIRETVMKVR